MLMAVILALAGLILIYAEFFLPGGIMGMSGVIALVTAVVFFAQESVSAAYLLLFIACIIVGLVATIRFALHRIRNSKSSGGGVYLDTDQEGFYTQGFDEDALGKRGVAATQLRPSGYVIVDSKRLQAVSRSGFIEKDVEVEVIAGEGAHLIVKPLKKE